MGEEDCDDEDFDEDEDEDSSNLTKEEINEALKKEANEPYYQGIVAVSEEPLVSSDYVGSSVRGTIDLLLTNVVDGNLAKVVVWYDNEWGYSSRLVDLTQLVGSNL